MSGQQDSKRQKVELQGEFHKIKPPTFDSEVEEVVEACLMNINKYCQVYEYSSNLNQIGYLPVARKSHPVVGGGEKCAHH